MIKVQWIFFLLITLYFITSYSQQCVPLYDLDNIRQDHIVIQPKSVNGVVQTQKIYNYPRIFFTTTPKIIYTYDLYQVNTFSELNYFLTVKVSRSSVNFTFNSQNMDWVKLGVKFWLTARSDILVGNFILQNIAAGSSQTYQISIPDTFSAFINEKTIQLNYITGLNAKTSGKLYEVDVKNDGKSVNGNTLKVTVSSLGQTSIQKIQISYTIFNFELSYFASGGGQLNYKSLQGSQYKKIHGSFSPIYYLIQGFDKLRLSSQDGMKLQFYFDDDYVLESYTKNKFQQIGVVYLSIGKQPSTVCSCDKYIQTNQCVDVCPVLTYPYIDYAKGGKTCLTCSSKLNETINQFNTGCDCNAGYERIDEVCLPKSSLPITECLNINTVLLNGLCVCLTGYQNVNGKCESVCNVNQFYNTNISKCDCNYGYSYLITTKTCGVCPSDQIYDKNYQACMCPANQFLDTTNNLCKCVPTFYNFTGACVKTCPTGYVVSNDNCIAAQKCNSNQIFQNGKCICTNSTYEINGTCAVCPTTTYYNLTSTSCINCMASCQICFNYSSCAECKKDYYYNSTANACQMNVTCKINETLKNGVCACVEGTYLIDGICAVCPQGKYYDSTLKSCKTCVVSCISCISSNSCNQCLTNFTFNSSLGYCAPNCGANQTLINGKCECVKGMYRINGVCNKCSLAQFYDSTSKQCYPCMINCLSCASPAICDRCTDLYYYNTTSNTCQLSNCQVNQTIVNGKCECVQGTYRINNFCGVCKQGQFYNSKSQACQNCPDNCLKCSNQASCNQCQPYHAIVNNYCQFDLYNLKEGYPKFTQDLIITDFTASQPTKVRQIPSQQLEKIVKLQVNNKDYEPGVIKINQNPKNLSQIRLIFSYCGYIPLHDYNIKYTFSDPKISIKQDIKTIDYKVMQKGLTNFFNQ